MRSLFSVIILMHSLELHIEVLFKCLILKYLFAKFGKNFDIIKKCFKKKDARAVRPYKMITVF